MGVWDIYILLNVGEGRVKELLLVMKNFSFEVVLWCYCNNVMGVVWYLYIYILSNVM